MGSMFRGTFMVLLATVAIVGANGCAPREEPRNPELKVPDVPPSASGSKKMPTKK